MKYIIGNWKSNKSLSEALAWFDDFKKVYFYDESVKVVVAVPFVFLTEVHKKVAELNLPIELAVQDISPFPYGAYTGAVTAEMVKDYATWVIVGHSERRKYFHETNQEIANKVARLAENNLGVVLCVDKPYASEQRAALTGELPKKLIVAYEPISAIGTGNPEDPSVVKNNLAEIKEIFDGSTVIYGGSTNPENEKEYFEISLADGLLPGGASLDAEKFARMCQIAAEE